MKKALVGLSVLLMSAGAYAESIKVSTSNYAPYVVVADGKVTSGVYVELLNAILKQSGVTVEYMAAPWKRATTMAETVVLMRPYHGSKQVSVRPSICSLTQS